MRSVVTLSLVALLSGACLDSPPQRVGDSDAGADGSPGDAMCSAFFADPFSDDELHAGRWEDYEEGGGTLVANGETLVLTVGPTATYAYAGMWSRDPFPATATIATVWIEVELDDLADAWFELKSDAGDIVGINFVAGRLEAYSLTAGEGVREELCDPCPTFDEGVSFGVRMVAGEDQTQLESSPAGEAWTSIASGPAHSEPVKLYVGAQVAPGGSAQLEVDDVSWVNCAAAE